jgi:hypothetical protein
MAEQLHENYPYKLYRQYENDIVLIDCSKKPDRLFEMIKFLKGQKPEAKYVVVESKLVIIKQS